MTKKEKFFKYSELSKMLPLIKAIQKDLHTTWKTILQLREKYRAGDEKSQELVEESNYYIDQLNRYIKEIEDLGGYVEQLMNAVVVFPTLVHGRKAFFVIDINDKEITYWHEWDEAYSDKQSLQSGAYLD